MAAWHAAPSPTWGRWQRVTNADWPSNPRQVVRRDRIPVRCRVVWLLDGPDVVDGHAIGWIGRRVWVELDDDRLGPLATWLDAEDVRRR